MLAYLRGGSLAGWIIRATLPSGSCLFFWLLWRSRPDGAVKPVRADPLVAGPALRRLPGGPGTLFFAPGARGLDGRIGDQRANPVRLGALARRGELAAVCQAVCRYVFVSELGLDKASSWFGRHGWEAVLIVRLLPGVGNLISVPAGPPGRRTTVVGEEQPGHYDLRLRGLRGPAAGERHHGPCGVAHLTLVGGVFAPFCGTERGLLLHAGGLPWSKRTFLWSPGKGSQPRK